MKHLKKFNENKNELDKEVLVNFFAHTFDLCNTSWEESGSSTVINIVYFDPKEEMSWAHNDFTGAHSTCVEGFELSFHVEFYDKTTLEEFDKYSEIVTQLKEDIDRFKSMYKVSEMFFENTDDSTIRLLIRP